MVATENPNERHPIGCGRKGNYWRSIRWEQLSAKVLNNQAASYIEIGRYDKAIGLLVDALCMSAISPSNPENKSNVPITSSSEIETRCGCSQCSLDACITFSEERAQWLQWERKAQEQVSLQKKAIGKKRSIEGREKDERTTASSHMRSKQHFMTGSNDKQNRSGDYIHRRPIRVTPVSIQECHAMGHTLSLIITFNLALANHLKVLTPLADGSGEKDVTDSYCRDNYLPRDAGSRRDTLRKVLRLYELAYKWKAELNQTGLQGNHGSRYDPIMMNERLTPVPTTGTTSLNNTPSTNSDNKQALHHASESNARTWNENIERNETSASESISNSSPSSGPHCSRNSLRFDMIVCNNLSQIHKMANNERKREKCLQHLLSIIMFVVDFQRESFDNFEISHSSQHQMQYFNRSIYNNNGDSYQNREVLSNTIFNDHYIDILEREDGRTASHRFMDVEGFWTNVSKLVLLDHCATAA